MSVTAASHPAPTTNKRLAAWVNDMAALCKPDKVVWADGSQEEYDRLCEGIVPD